MENDLTLKAKHYSNIKYGLAIIDTLFLLSVLALFLTSGLSSALSIALSRVVHNYYLAIGVYLLLAFLAYNVLELPLNLYRSFIVERRFGLSNQTIKDWLKDHLKTMVLSFVIFAILAEAFYYILNRFASDWWIVASLFWIFFSVVLARLTPVLIIPLFFKYQPLSDAVLRQRVIDLAGKMKIRILDVFEIDFSKKTLKANAAFVGMGRTKRVILADTLKDKYSHDEIEVILAHEFAHYRQKHLLKLLLVNAMGIILSFYVIFKSGGYVLGLFGIGSLTEIAALPLILVYLTLFGIILTPLQNYLSRRFERQADRIALEFTGFKESFVSMMNKLADQNLADRQPSRLIKIFFFDHPAIGERIAAAG